MKLTLFILATALIATILSCGKDKFQTKPLIEIKGYNNKDIVRTPLGNELTITLKYFDKEGDMSQAQFFAVRQRLNVRPLPPSNDKADTLRYNLPSFPDETQGEIVFQLGHQSFLKESPTENDTLVFRIAVTDRAGNKSDTITTSKLVIIN